MVIFRMTKLCSGSLNLFFSESGSVMIYLAVADCAIKVNEYNLSGIISAIYAVYIPHSVVICTLDCLLFAYFCVIQGQVCGCLCSLCPFERIVDSDIFVLSEPHFSISPFTKEKKHSSEFVVESCDLGSKRDRTAIFIESGGYVGWRIEMETHATTCIFYRVPGWEQAEETKERRPPPRTDTHEPRQRVEPIEIPRTTHTPPPQTPIIKVRQGANRTCLGGKCADLHKINENYIGIGFLETAFLINAGRIGYGILGIQS